MNASKKGSTRSNKKASVRSYKEKNTEKDTENDLEESHTSIHDIQIIPLQSIQKKQEEPVSIERPPHILSNDVSDIYRVINSDIQYRKSKKESEKLIEETKEEEPVIRIESNNLEKNKMEYMRKIETKITNDKFHNDLKELDFAEDLNNDGDMQKMKEHVKKLQEIRMEKQSSGVDSSKEGAKMHEKRKEGKAESNFQGVQVENVKINLETLGVQPTDNNRPLSMENDFIPELLNDSKKSGGRGKSGERSPPSRNASPNVESTPGVSNRKFTDFSNNSNTEYEKRNNGSFYDKSNEEEGRFDSKEKDFMSEDTFEKAKKMAQMKGNNYSEDSFRKDLYTYGATSSKR